MGMVPNMTCYFRSHYVEGLDYLFVLVFRLSADLRHRNSCDNRSSLCIAVFESGCVDGLMQGGEVDGREVIV